MLEIALYIASALGIVSLLLLIKEIRVHSRTQAALKAMEKSNSEWKQAAREERDNYEALSDRITSQVNIKITQGKGSLYRWSAYDQVSNQYVAGGPINGFTSKKRAAEHARKYLNIFKEIH